MAEVSGLVIGSVQLIDTVLKLKRTFNGIGTLPQHARNFLSELASSFEAKLSRQKGLRRGAVMAKLFLQKDQLESLQNKLDRAVQLLKSYRDHSAMWF
ncbi:hypothetical protein VUR80DRAFT_9104 [Thermomyces stellatus]